MRIKISESLPWSTVMFAISVQMVEISGLQCCSIFHSDFLWRCIVSIQIKDTQYFFNPALSKRLMLSKRGPQIKFINPIRKFLKMQTSLHLFYKYFYADWSRTPTTSYSFMHEHQHHYNISCTNRQLTRASTGQV